MAEESVPEGVIWNKTEGDFFDTEGKRKGSKFFEEWKERRDEFPSSIRRPRSVNTPVPRSASAPEPSIPDALLATASRRKQLFDAYTQVGFTRAEALELCTRD